MDTILHDIGSRFKMGWLDAYGLTNSRWLTTAESVNQISKVARAANAGRPLDATPMINQMAAS